MLAEQLGQIISYDPQLRDSVNVHCHYHGTTPYGSTASTQQSDGS